MAFLSILSLANGGSLWCTSAVRALYSLTTLDGFVATGEPIRSYQRKLDQSARAGRSSLSTAEQITKVGNYELPEHGIMTCP